MSTRTVRITDEQLRVFAAATRFMAATAPYEALSGPARSVPLDNFQEELYMLARVCERISNSSKSEATSMIYGIAL